MVGMTMFPPYETMLDRRADPPEQVRSGYDALGYPVPPERLQAAYVAVKDMLPGVTTEDAMGLVGRVATCVERDDPYGALLDHSQGFKTDLLLDLTGRYRLLATLLCAEVTR